MAGVAFGDILLRAWVRLCALGPGLVTGDAAVLCVAGVGLGDTHLRFAWHAWHVVTSAFVLRGRRGACCAWWRAWVRLGPGWSPVTPRYFAAGVALVALGGVLGRAWAGLGALGPGLVAGDGTVLGVVGVALGVGDSDIHLRFACPARRGIW